MTYKCSSLKECDAEGYTLPETLSVLFVISILSIISIPSYFSMVRKVSCISGKMDLPGLCWSEAQKPGSCWVASNDCFFPRPGRRPGDVYSKPDDSKEVSGFYVILTSPNSTATVRYKAYLCSGATLGAEGSKLIGSSLTDSDYLDKKSNYVSFPQGVCGFEFYLIQKSRSTGARIEFITNFSIKK
ncbi:hypothetical protein H6F76_25130 [Leptolyngbya sp. FACHB-321]|uniref:hypothetical protein n=1 Tax=Leptolyngbya sp. FACHB-321 TaxID=2692807 RepID=UPI0016856436|nr:hypothetical protein [Leptolyngbya sp. FACHB-321]MBD2038240.1 hypothetical protein [Leptolyngbya sp. FACHB-321]